MIKTTAINHWMRFMRNLLLWTSANCLKGVGRNASTSRSAWRKSNFVQNAAESPEQLRLSNVRCLAVRCVMYLAKQPTDPISDVGVSAGLVSRSVSQVHYTSHSKTSHI